DRADVGGDPGRYGWIGVGRAHGAPVDPVQVLVDVERLLHLVDGAGRGHEEPVLRHVDDVEAGVADPGAHGVDLRGGRRVAGAELRRRHPALVGGGCRVVEAGEGRIDPGRVTPAEPD